MLKKFLLLFSVLLLVPFSTFAISLSDIRSNEDRYIYQGINTYLDFQSVRMIRNEHPFYETECLIYAYKADADTIIEFQTRFLYDYNRSEFSLYNETKAEPSRYQMDRQTEIFKVARAKQKKDCGISATVEKVQFYQADGRYLGKDESGVETTKIAYNIPFASAADTAFRKCFGVPFLFSQIETEKEVDMELLFAKRRAS